MQHVENHLLQYRNKYPGLKDDPNADKNVKFYSNEINAEFSGDLIKEIHTNWFGDYKRLVYGLKWRAYLSAEDKQYEKSFTDLLTAYKFGKHLNNIFLFRFPRRRRGRGGCCFF